MTTTSGSPKFETKFEICHHSYLRGLDGITAEEATAKEANRVAGSGTSSNNRDMTQLINRWLPGKSPELPLGNNQFDYIARLTAEIKRESPTPFAIGILGSDTYDKLMLLQAFRTTFPDTLFFTTDLDAQYLDSESVRSTHGMLVASPYGLKLNENLQRKTPSFRGSYQTALFHAVLAAAADSNLNGKKTHFLYQSSIPRVFEIGWYNPVDLTLESYPGSSILDTIYWSDISANVDASNQGKHATLHPLSPRTESIKLFTLYNLYLFGLFMVMLAGFIIATGQKDLTLEIITGKWVDKIHPQEDFPGATGDKFRKKCKWIFPTILCGIVLVVVILPFLPPLQQYGGEPFSLWEGISEWPLFLVHLTVVFLGIVFLFIETRDSRKVLSDVSKTAFPNIAVQNLTVLLNASKYDLFQMSLWNNVVRYGLDWLRGKTASKKSKDDDLCDDLSDRWKQYWSHSDDRFYLVLSLTVLCSLIFGVFMLFSYNWMTFRGFNTTIMSFFAFALMFGATLLAYLMMNFLSFITVVDNNLCAKFISDLSGERKNTSFIWDLSGERKNTSEINTLKIIPKNAFSLENSTHFRLIRLVGEWTHTMRKVVWLPATMLFILLCTRVFFLENFGWGSTVRLCYGLIITAMIFFPAYNLYVKARKLRTNLLTDLREREILAEVPTSSKEPEKVTAAQIRLVAGEIEKYQKGIFSPLLWHPMAWAFALLSGGVSFPLLFDLFFR